MAGNMRRMKNNTKPKNEAITKKEILKDLRRVTDLYRKQHPEVTAITRDYYRKHGKYTEKDLTQHYGNFRMALTAMRKFFGDITRNDILRKDKNNSSGKTFFVTSVIPGATVKEKYLNSIKCFLRERGAELIILAMRGIKDKDEFYQKDVVEQYGSRFFTEYKFSDNLTALDMRLHPQHFYPLASMEKIAKEYSSIIIAHPRQRLIVAPVPHGHLPSFLWSTGSISLPKYAETRSGRFALKEHVFGGLVVEVDKDGISHIRPVQFDKYGNFYDLNQYFTQKDVKKCTSTVATLGDIHAGLVDNSARLATFEQIELLKPKEVFVGDVFDAASISHHTANDRYAKHRLPQHLKTLEKELHTYAKELLAYRKVFPKLKINLVFGNHEDHLYRYLKEGRYVYDIPENYYIAVELSKYMLDGFNPIEKWCKKNYPELRKNVKWLKNSDLRVVDGITMSVHGHKGYFAVKGTPAIMERSYGKSNTGHLHSARIVGGAYVAGCMCIMDMPYTLGGATNWTHSNIFNFPGGQRQIYTSILGKWRLPKGKKENRK